MALQATLTAEANATIGPDILSFIFNSLYLLNLEPASENQEQMAKLTSPPDIRDGVYRGTPNP